MKKIINIALVCLKYHLFCLYCMVEHTNSHLLLPGKDSLNGKCHKLAICLACEMTAVATDCESSGSMEILDNDKFGYLCPIENTQLLSDKIIESINKPIPKDTAIDRGNFFSIDNSMKQCERLFASKVDEL